MASEDLKSSGTTGAYDATAIESRLAESWQQSKTFHADPASAKPPFSIVIPPPNVTGSLHLGHALNNTLQDILVRYQKMSGAEVLWMPGTDHAGIATQNVVEKQLAQAGQSKHDLGREKFLERVWEWKDTSGGQIISQLKRLGCSCDWERERFTMDQGLSKAVREVFVRLYKEGLIYRGDYMINWCPRCESALADLEVEYPDQATSGMIYRLRYELVESPGNYLMVDTTRPETMLGDTAVAVHPEDERYQKLHGAKLRLPITGRIIPVIADAFVDREFGTGVVKITPGHDPNDFEAGRRHQLPIITVLDQQGKMNDQALHYKGLDRFECRKKILVELESLGALVEKKPHLNKIGRCYRCQTVTEPLVSTQWFMRMRELADQAIQAVREGRTEIIPQAWSSTYYQWLENIRDWCISRQLWWGHQIPVWYCECGQEIVSTETPTACACGSKKLRQDPDVLDTWFSSALWPFSTMGWPDQTATLQRFYPTSVLVTGFDILFFWVARMMMMGIKLTGVVPFHKVYLHAMVRDEHGQKMSKTKGNVIDPLDLIRDYGADALRFTLCIMTLQGRDVNISTKRIEGYRNFINKIWNATRYTAKVVEEVGTKPQSFDPSSFGQWILSRLSTTTAEVNAALSNYQFSEACSALYRFFWDDFCAWYLEASKPLIKLGDINQQQAIANTLNFVVETTLKLLHPVIPFVTTQIWQDRHQTDIVLEKFPQLSDLPQSLDQQKVQTAAVLIELITAIRTARAEKNVPPSSAVTVSLECSAELQQVLSLQSDLIVNLARLTELKFSSVAPAGDYVSKLFAGANKVHLSLQGLIDPEAEKQKLLKQQQSVEKELARVKNKLASTDFRARAPEMVVQKEEEKLREFEAELKIIRQALAGL
ncbi:valine--tRNA ligase [bacterium]|nr:valine--tRNA ligase [bacterium]